MLKRKLSALLLKELNVFLLKNELISRLMIITMVIKMDRQGK